MVMYILVYHLTYDGKLDVSIVLYCLIGYLGSRPILQRLNYLGTCKHTLQQCNYVAMYNKSIVQQKNCFDACFIY